MTISSAPERGAAAGPANGNAAAPLPLGFRIAVAPDTKQLDDRTLFGGSPGRVLRLSPAGAAAWQHLGQHPVSTPAQALVARRLVDVGLADPVPPAYTGVFDVTVVIPVRDRAELLDRCLRSLGSQHRVLVVDDGSADPSGTQTVAARYGASVVLRGVNGGPGAARNTALHQVTSEFVAFLDSDCVAEQGWLEALSAHLLDPLVAAVAPRISAVPSQTAAGRYGAVRGGLDLGDRAGRVVPGSRISYVPTAALVVRRAALDAVTTPDAAAVFDPQLRFGEDVDLVWRLHRAGWRVRYDPSVVIAHREPDRWVALLSRRFDYGTSAAPLAKRHPGALSPMVLHPWPAATVAALLARRPVLAGLAFGGAVFTTGRTLRQAGIPSRGVLSAMATAVRQTWLGSGRYSTQFAAPALMAAVAAPTHGRRRGRVRRTAAASLLFGPPLIGWLGDFGRRGDTSAGVPRLDPLRYVAAHLADDVAYGTGVWTSVLRHRDLAAVRPRVVWRPLRLAPRSTSRLATPPPPTPAPPTPAPPAPER